METLPPNRAGLTLGAVLGGWHLGWSLLVASGWAQPVLDFIFRIHFIRPVYVVGEFDVRLAAALVAVTALIGYAIGAAAAFAWNRLRP